MNWNGVLASTRPKTLFASLGPVFIGGAVSYETENPWLFILILLCAVLLQIGSNLVNDYFDAKDGIDTKNRLGPLRAIHKGLITIEELKKACLLCFILAFVIGCIISYFSGIEIFILGIVCLLFAFLYTGGPFPLSRYGLGEIAAFVFFGPVPVLGTQYILLGKFSLDGFIFSLIPGLLSSLLMAVNNLRDRESDKQTGKLTIASFLSEKWARSFTFTILLFHTLILVNLSLFYNYGTYFNFALLGVILFWKKFSMILKSPIDENFNGVLESVGKYLAINCFIISLVIHLHHRGIL